MQKYGIDISKWQGKNFDLQAAKDNYDIEFVIIKCGGSDKGVYRDSQFENNYNKAKAAGLSCGSYWFSKALTVEEAQRDAEYCYKLLQGKQFELPIYIDVENKEQLRVGVNRLTAIIDAFCDYLEKRGYYVGIYSSKSFFKTYMDDNYLKKYAHWVAAWNYVKPILESGATVGLWQFGGETNKLKSNKINGQTVDQDYLYIDYETVIKKNGLNGFGVDNTIRNTLVALVEKGYNIEKIQEVIDTMKGV